MSWSEHVNLLINLWEPGRSITIIAPTGTGKSYLSRHGLLPVLNSGERVLIFEDDAEQKWPGFSIKIKRFPTRAWREYYRARYGEQYRPVFRLIIPEDLTQKSILEERRRVFGAMRMAFKERNWVIVMPEIVTFAEPMSEYGLGLKGPLNIMWRKARRRKLTIIAETQAPRWLPRAAYDQPIGVYIGAVGDHAAALRLREIGGNSQAILEAIKDLGEHEFVFAGKAGRVLQRVEVGK